MFEVTLSQKNHFLAADQYLYVFILKIWSPKRIDTAKLFYFSVKRMLNSLIIYGIPEANTRNKTSFSHVRNAPFLFFVSGV